MTAKCTPTAETQIQTDGREAGVSFLHSNLDKTIELYSAVVDIGTVSNLIKRNQPRQVELLCTRNVS